MDIVEGIKRAPTDASGKTAKAFFSLCRTFIILRTGLGPFFSRVLFLLELLQFVALSFFSLVSRGQTHLCRDPSLSAPTWC
ncbi:MAG: hypothetical protein P4M11_11080 [Candidatus Pacebacteria bacterium]|nr:hypothetical protein [Candidatus Paceibacterota bacterium]